MELVLSQPGLAFELPGAVALLDETVPIRLSGLPAGRFVTVRLEQHDSAGLWRSHAILAADDSGRIDLSRMAPLSGTYSGVAPMGLVWSVQRDNTIEPRERHPAPDLAPVTAELTAEIEGRPTRLHLQPLEYFESALAWLAAHPAVDEARTGVFGSSRGGELVLLLGATYPQIAAVVAHVPSHVLWEGCCDPVALDAPAWTHEGNVLPHIQVEANVPGIGRHGERQCTRAHGALGEHAAVPGQQPAPAPAGFEVNHRVFEAPSTQGRRPTNTSRRPAVLKW